MRPLTPPPTGVARDAVCDEDESTPPGTDEDPHLVCVVDLVLGESLGPSLGSCLTPPHTGEAPDAVCDEGESTPPHTDEDPHLVCVVDLG